MAGGKWAFALVVGVVLVLLVSGCTQENNEWKGMKPGQSAYVQLSFAESPILGKDVNLVMYVKALTDYNDGEFGINLSSNFNAISCDKVWKTNLLDGEEINFNCTVRAVKEGYTEISGYAVSGILPQSKCPSKTHRCANKVGTDRIYVHVYAGNTIVTDNPVAYNCKDAKTIEEVENCLRVNSVPV